MGVDRRWKDRCVLLRNRWRCIGCAPSIAELQVVWLSQLSLSEEPVRGRHAYFLRSYQVGAGVREGNGDDAKDPNPHAQPLRAQRITHSVVESYPADLARVGIMVRVWLGVKVRGLVSVWHVGFVYFGAVW